MIGTPELKGALQPILIAPGTGVGVEASAAAVTAVGAVGRVPGMMLLSTSHAEAPRAFNERIRIW